MFTAEQITELVSRGIPGAEAKVVDRGGDNYHVELVVVSAAFEGKGLVERHRMVYSAIGNAVGNEIHALSIKTMTPREAGR